MKYERSFDRFHAKAQDIYRVQYNGYQSGKLRFECAAAVPAVGPALKDNFPEVKQFTRLFSVDFVRLVLLATVLSIPIAYFGMNQWLEGYAYRISV